MPLGSRRIKVIFGVVDRPSAALLAVAAALLVANTAVVTALILPRVGESVVRLRYAAAFGVDWAAAWWKALVFPAAGLAALVINGLFAGRLAAQHRLFAPLVWGTTVLIETIFTAAAFMAWQLNI